jgi:L-alanine-DL-glutamate epimerase-like enolase superfamily enzyme
VTCQYLIVTTVHSSDGSTGQGFSWAVRAGGQAIQAMVDADCRPVAEGGPVVPAAAWDRLWWHLREAGGGIATLAMAAIDIGLWDLQAKAANLSLADLLGRQRDRVAVYASGVNRHLTLDELREQVSRWIAAGHSRVKIKVGLPSLEEDLERVGAVRQIMGPGRPLMVDANQLWDLPTARRAARALSAFDIFWLEEPLPAEDFGAFTPRRSSGTCCWPAPLTSSSRMCAGSAASPRSCGSPGSPACSTSRSCHICCPTSPGSWPCPCRCRA